MKSLYIVSFYEDDLNWFVDKYTNSKEEQENMAWEHLAKSLGVDVEKLKARFVINYIIVVETNLIKEVYESYAKPL